jgi:hypothetical protein
MPQCKGANIESAAAHGNPVGAECEEGAAGSAGNATAAVLWVTMVPMTAVRLTQRGKWPLNFAGQWNAGRPS